MASEAKRACGYRKIGGLYLAGDGPSASCDLLPFRLHVCPTCHHGIKQSRGWTWVDVPALFEFKGSGGTEHDGCLDQHHCALCSGSVQRAGLIWIGTEFYKTPDQFTAEAREMGVSRRLSAIPRQFKVGETWILFAHPKAIQGHDEKGELVYQKGIFQAWRPTRIEIILPDNAALEDVQAAEARGFTPVFVKADDPDHQPKKKAPKVRVAQGPRTGLNAIIGQWPGDESDEDIFESPPKET